MAAPNPIGTANIAAISVIFNVPITKAQMPYLGLDENGAHSVVKRNSVMDTLVKNVIVSVNNVTNMPIVTNIDINEITARIIGTILSLLPPFLRYSWQSIP